MRASFVQAARSLQLDLTAAEVGTALAESDVSCILVRGPSLTRWLYPQNQGRNYIDVDLLVSPDRFGTAERALESLGFAHVPTMMQRSDDRPVHARTWYREADSAAVDLHRTIIGARAADAVVWDTLSRETESIQVGGKQLEGLNATATALVVALHVAQHGKQTPKPLNDLRQALERLPQATWAEAARLARQLDATESFGLGLRLLPGGKSLADDLGLPVILTAEGMLRSRTPPPTALGFEWLTHVPGTRAKARLLAGKLVPDTEFMHAWSPLARRGRAGLFLAYMWRPLWLAWQAPRGFRAWTQARKRAGP
jgi:putative nucleotidyltransferase-like protein